MPSPDRDTSAAIGAGAGDDRTALREKALQVLLDPALEHIVELVAWSDGTHVYAETARGAARVRRDDPAGAHEVLRGDDPLAHQDPLALTPAAAEAATPRPRYEQQSYPHAGTRLASLFAAEDRAPDLAVVHTDAHHWPERGGHIGEHGSLGVLQSRAPLILSGAGVAARGVLARSARTVDVMPTLAALAGVGAPALAELDGTPLDLAAPTGGYVVGLLWDGTNAQDLYELAQRGELPNVARLLERGCALAGGAVAEFPSVTIVNHTSALTGLGPGRHGIVNNTYFDRATDAQILANDEATWVHACDLLRPGVRTLWEVVREARPDSMLACVDEPIDRGASYSTFQLVRASGTNSSQALAGALPNATTDPNTTAAMAESNSDYAWGSRVDGAGLGQVLALWSQPEPPAVMWWNSTLPDAAHHNGGPRSEMSRAGLRDSDRRLGQWLDLVESRGLLDQVTVLMTADHGMAEADPACTGDWDEALREAGIPFRDESYGFIYLG
ncbi:MAG TPA: alkaline phosphatase family protein [Mycobacteriales bacterium]|nr:alkaline phosphatase family protein [Mycobacteriales bacterium]